MKKSAYTLKKPASFIERSGFFSMPVRGKKMRRLWTAGSRQPAAGSRYFFGFGKVKEEMSGMRVIRAIT